MMHMFGNDQRDEHVRVEQRRHSSSSNERTSSVVTTVPTLTRGNPVRGSVEIAAGPPARRPRRTRSATVSLNVRSRVPCDRQRLFVQVVGEINGSTHTQS